ncbi:hypothetical protein LR48_Vigan08g148400 [Vigna angularis]|uniref:Bifunctional inhibitor/plant lipid transfer protein/seed storage helical domain-containing protein n=1 Tax=Phaseolus angularis TaxID=3914 RepID=A0A0L9V6V3_PHAAN|nr:hypothetical protein LR48_Vigan08g148400 [Vigna angularis]
MVKNEMKNVGVVVVIMMMLCFSEAAELTCRAKCGIDCLLANIAYPICFAICVAKCPKLSKEASECITRCGVNKFIKIKIGIQTFTTLLLYFSYFS